jgi:uncharacterized membrane-anchored protein YhcB (DUF1043 family)
MALDLALAFVPLLIGLGAGLYLGRNTGKMASRVHELESQVEGLRKAHELALAESEARKEEIRRRREELEEYRGQVVDHFAGASDLLRELTLHYRAVYGHLAEGAQNLCPEGSLALDVDLCASALPPTTESVPPAEQEGEAAAGKQAGSTDAEATASSPQAARG